MRLLAILCALALCGCDCPTMGQLDNFCDIEYLDGSKQTLICSWVEFRRGYAHDAPRMAFWCKGIETTSGLMPYAFVAFPADRCLHPEWGEPDQPHFFIELGGRVRLASPN